MGCGGVLVRCGGVGVGLGAFGWGRGSCLFFFSFCCGVVFFFWGVGGWRVCFCVLVCVGAWGLCGVFFFLCFVFFVFLLLFSLGSGGFFCVAPHPFLVRASSPTVEAFFRPSFVLFFRWPTNVFPFRAIFRPAERTS